MMKNALYRSPGNHLRRSFGGAILAAAARYKRLGRQHHYSTRMLEIRQTCHGKYATDKSPGFGGEAPVARPC